MLPCTGHTWISAFEKSAFCSPWLSAAAIEAILVWAKAVLVSTPITGSTAEKTKNLLFMLAPEPLTSSLHQQPWPSVSGDIPDTLFPRRLWLPPKEPSGDSSQTRSETDSPRAGNSAPHPPASRLLLRRIHTDKANCRCS